MITCNQLSNFLNEHLCPSVPIKDYCPNGLQVQGKETIAKIVTGVTASLDFLECAASLAPDAVLVHHGLFWHNTMPTLIGPLYQRVRLLLSHDINLFAYHLPLDLHPVVGNNAQLAQQLEIEITGHGTMLGVADLGTIGCLKTPMTPTVLGDFIHQRLLRAPLHIAPLSGASLIKTVAFCTGAAQDGIEWAARLGVDAYLSGEISERTTHLAREWGIHYFACGHHATERYGVQAVGKMLSEKYGVEHIFVDIDNPV